MLSSWSSETCSLAQRAVALALTTIARFGIARTMGQRSGKPGAILAIGTPAATETTTEPGDKLPLI